MELNSLLIISAIFLGQVSDSPAADLSLTVQRLVRQLDDDQLAKRVEAEQALSKLGPEALELLPLISEISEAEVKERLIRVRKKLESVVAETATKASQVTLVGDFSLADALALLQEQSGNRVVGAQNRDVKVKADFHNVSYWKALDSILDQAGLTINPYGGQENALSVTARPDSQLPRVGRAVYNGLFRFEASQLDAVRDLRNPQVSGLRLSLEISWEPRMVPISISQPLNQIKAFDENGDPIGIDGRQAVINVPVQSGLSAVDLIIPLELPKRQVHKIASLQGTLTAMLPGRIEIFKFTDIEKAKDVQQQRAGVTVVLEQLRKNVDLFEVRILVRFDKAANALESHRGWIYNNQVYLLDPQGKKIESLGIEATRQETNAVGLAFLFDLENGPANHQFIYHTPAAIIKLPVQYEIKNIDLP